ncbi:cadherin-related family member 1-like [Biomphalaria glabrata]|uniref:Cadherin-related family member 1-like n=1 Tax=Biomphalaria glabrata TaxID=6526 RepID=A0A9W2ZQM2_BIOGL|nr:cadherin-related family member 1-like [Biomphalaria glabrata]
MAIITKHLLISYCLFISVESQSNRPPTVNSLNNYFTVFENASTGSLIYQFNATDPDNDVLTFSFGSSDTDSLVNVTQLSSSGNIYTCGLFLKTQLDRDNSPSVRQLHVKIKDLLFEITYKIFMIINDVNDNPPTFTGLPYRFSLLEDTALLTPVFTVSATDPDTGSGGQIFYSMNASSSSVFHVPIVVSVESGPIYFVEMQDDADYNETFSLTSNTGIIHLKRKLDYETKSFYHFKVYSRVCINF